MLAFVGPSFTLRSFCVFRFSKDKSWKIIEMINAPGKTDHKALVVHWADLVVRLQNEKPLTAPLPLAHSERTSQLIPKTLIGCLHPSQAQESDFEGSHFH